jgi:DNA-binding SARP family transcriptional activator/tetratricopeptide (TPR) repeat protein
MRFRILGPLEVLSPDGWAPIGAGRWRSLLAALLLRRGQLVPTDTLIDDLWGDSPPDTANNLVSIYVHRLKKVIGDTEGRMLVYRAPGYLLRLDPGDLDLDHFESLAAGGRAVIAADPRRAADLLGQALSLWRGPLLADVPPTQLIARQADRVAELWLTSTEQRAEADLVAGRADQVIPELRALVASHQLRERLWALLMRALEESGRRAEALDTYTQARQAIADELGVDPGAELQRLYAQLLAADAAPAPAAARPRRRRPAPAAAASVPPGPLTARPDGPGDAEDGPGPSGQAATGKAGAEPPGSIAIGTFAESALPGTPGLAAAGPGAPGAAAGFSPGMLRPAQLPADIGDFTGRTAHVDYLCGLLLSGNDVTSPGAVRIAVVNGAGGLGKTTLAVHAAHQVAAQFPDGQLYVDLLGASPQAAAPGEVLARFLRELGLEGDKVPVRDDERAALYRSALTGRRVLILLDNAKDAAQVRPLLPGSSSCAVLITTRNRTADLAATRFVDLDVLEDTEALALFSRIVGERAAAEPDATAEVLVACAGLPLAIRICAARLAKRRQWRVATLADRLRDQHRRLDELTTGDLAVRASFQVSYDSLKPPAAGPAAGQVSPAQAFRLLGLWQGARISRAAAAALAGVPEDDIADALETLVDVNLLESPAPDWYRFHDLLRVYATERATAEESAAARDAAVRRLLYWYLDTAQAAADTVSPQRYQVPREAAGPGQPTLAFAATDAALGWYGDERANIVAATRQAAEAGLHEVASHLPPTLFPLFNRWGNWADCVTTHRVAVTSAASGGDLPTEAWALNQLGFAQVSLRDQEAFGHLERALSIRREAGDARGEAQTAIALGEAHLRMRGAGEDALTYLRRATALLEPMGAISLRSVALNNLGEVYFGLGDLDAAAGCYQQALQIDRATGGYAGGHALHNLGRVYLHQRRPEDAIARLTEALAKHRASGDLDGGAWALKSLGEAQAGAGAGAEARASWIEALRIFEQVGNQEQVAETSALLASLPVGWASPPGPARPAMPGWPDHPALRH